MLRHNNINISFEANGYLGKSNFVCILYVYERAGIIFKRDKHKETLYENFIVKIEYILCTCIKILPFTRPQYSVEFRSNTVLL